MILFRELRLPDLFAVTLCVRLFAEVLFRIYKSIMRQSNKCSVIEFLDYTGANLEGTVIEKNLTAYRLPIIIDNQ